MQPYSLFVRLSCGQDAGSRGGHLTWFGGRRPARSATESEPSGDPDAEDYDGDCRRRKASGAHSEQSTFIAPARRACRSGREGLELPEGVTLACRPATLRAEAGRPVAQHPAIRFEGLSAAALTSFLAFHATIARGGHRAQADFVLNVPAEGMPADRRDRLLRDVLHDRRSVLRLLLLLLAESGADVQHILDAHRGKTGADGDGLGGLAGEDLFEQLVRALHRRPERIGEVRDLVAELRRTPEGAALLPEGFDAVFEPVLAAWKEVEA